jgi:hypothetical protein
VRPASGPLAAPAIRTETPGTNGLVTTANLNALLV